MFGSAAKEISQWAERCRVWADAARTPEQRKMLQSMESLLSQAAVDAQRNVDLDSVPRPLIPNS